MHYAEHTSRGASRESSSREGSEKQSRVKASDFDFPVPDYILEDIIPISDPKLFYTNIHAQRERRLRLLIRRYTNQIQYGCKNVNCTTPSCLGYRKRHSTAPLRRYTELSARSLACQLVDDFTRSGREQPSGLCQNDPVVPWYEDPARTKKRRSTVEKPEHHRHEHGESPKGQNSSQRVRESAKHASGTEHPPRRPSQDGIVQAGRQLRTLDISKGDETIRESALDVLNSTLARDQSPTRAGDIAVDNSESSGDLSPAPAKPKDLASFTQTLFDLVPLRLLSWLPARSSPSSSNSSNSTGHPMSQRPHDASLGNQDLERSIESTQEPPTPDTSGQACDLMETKSSQTYTLQTLSWPSLMWLRTVNRLQDDENFEKSSLAFLKQAFVYCLSNPERLVKSVKSLQDGYGGQNAKNATNATLSRANGAVESSGGLFGGGNPPNLPQNPLPENWPTIATNTKSDLEGLLMSLVFLDNFGQRDLIFNSIFTALQHSYRLPRQIQDRTTGKRSRSASGSGEGASRKNRAPIPANDSRNSLPHDSNTSPEEEIQYPPLMDSQVTELCLIALLSIASLTFDARHDEFWSHKPSFERFADVRNSGLAHSQWPKIQDLEENRREVLHFVGSIITAIDISEHWSVLRLLYSVTDIIGHRLMATKWATALKYSDPPKGKNKTVVELLIDRFDRATLSGWDGLDKDSSWTGTAVIELMRTVMLKSWDRRPIVQRAGPVGGALELLAGLYRERKALNLDTGLFHMPFVADTFDEMSMPSEWLSFRADTRQMHLLSFSFLFEPATLVRYFRAINIDVMRKSHENATLVFSDTRQYMWAPAIPIYGGKEILSHLRPHMAKYFVLTIRRDDVLNDAINQIWRRQRRELMRPLRVRLGKDEGEDGLDHGGVQQEFFRVVFAEAFRPDYGMFTVDGTTKMTWFQPGSFETRYKFEALGILMSIAVYNGITLPITFPLAFYRKLLGLKVKKLEHVADGWPDLTRGLRSLLNWWEGDVGDVIARTYEFSYELCGSNVTVDMQKTGRTDPAPATGIRTSKKGKEKSKSTSFELPVEPSLTPPIQTSPTLNPTIVPALSRTSSVEIKGISTPLSIDSDMLEEAALVTNDNREQYVKDYVLWLTDKSIQPQYEAFARGFYTCLDRTALSIFTPEALKSVIEGHPEIDIDELEGTVTYDDYEKTSPAILDFWHIVRNFSPDQHRQLLEFVTASDRVPVNGIGSIQFIVQKNGDDDHRLPSSSTCYGRLLLPQYSSRQIMEEKLTKAIENCVGFGTL